MATVRVDIIGSTFTRGVFSNRHDTATVHAMLTNEGLGPLFNNTQSDYQRAVNAYIAEEGLYYPTVFAIKSDGTNDEKTNIGPQLLPILKTRAQRYGPTKMLVTALYQRTPGIDQPDDPAAHATARNFETSTRVYRTTSRTNDEGEVVETDIFVDGFPDGDFVDPDAKLNIESKKPKKEKAWPLSGSTITLSFLSSGLPPIAALESFKGKINDAPVMFLGYFFSAFTIKFAGYETDFSGDGAVSVRLDFAIVAPGWLEQTVVAVRVEDPQDPDETVFVAWTTIISVTHEPKNFLLFPPI